MKPDKHKSLRRLYLHTTIQLTRSITKKIMNKFHLLNSTNRVRYRSRKTLTVSFFTVLILSLSSCDPQQNGNETGDEELMISKEEMFDRIKGGLTGQILGNLNGLPHEFKYVDEPGTVKEYTPSLPEGARTDDDTDIEWMYIYYMDQQKELYLNKDSIPGIWKKHINYKVWASNLTARWLMEMGFMPYETGNAVLNPWARVNLGGQFTCEAFGLMAPGMPMVAEKTGLHYTRVIIDGDPAQATQFFTAMIAEAFRTSDLEAILQTGIEALDGESETYKAVQDVLAWHRQYPADWQAVRRLIMDKYHGEDGKLSINNSGVNLSAILAALLYGSGDFIESMILAFNMGWDADCNAATVGTILGVIHGYQWMEGEGWEITDRYWNTARPGLPDDETISSFAERILRLAEISILENGGEKREENGKIHYTIPYLAPASLHTPVDREEKYQALEEKYSEEIKGIFASGDPEEKALLKAGYLAVVFHDYQELRDVYPETYNRFLELFHAKPILSHTFLNLPDYISSDLKKDMRDAGIHEVDIEPSMKGNTVFVLEGFPGADMVFVGGTFNNWEAWMTPLQKTDEGWICRLDLEPGRYEYKFIVTEGGKSKWVFDPENPLVEKNHDGYENSVIYLPEN